MQRMLQFRPAAGRAAPWQGMPRPLVPISAFLDARWPQYFPPEPMATAFTLCTGPIAGAVSIGKGRVLVSVQGDGVSCYDINTQVGRRCGGGTGCRQRMHAACTAQSPAACGPGL